MVKSEKLCTFVNKTLFLGCHDKIMSFVLVVDDVLQIDTFGLEKVVEKLLVENEGHARNLFNLTFGLSTSAI